MTGPELRAVRLALRLNLKQFGRALAYEGKTPDILVSQMEGGGKPIPAYIARLAAALALLGRKIPRGWIVLDRVDPRGDVVAPHPRRPGRASKYRPRF